MSAFVISREDVKSALPNYEEVKQYAASKLAGDFSSLYNYSQACTDVFFCKAYLQEKAADSLTDLKNVLAARVFLSAGESVNLVTCTGTGSITIPPDGSNYKVNLNSWCMAFFTAILSGDRDTAGKLAGLDAAALLRHSGSKAVYMQAVVNAWQQYFKKEEAAFDEVLSGMDATSSLAPADVFSDKALDIDGPPLEALSFLLEKNKKGFEERMQNAIRWHRKYHERLQAKGNETNDLLISLPLSVLIHLAATVHGWDLNLNSEYIYYHS